MGHLVDVLVFPWGFVLNPPQARKEQWGFGNARREALAVPSVSSDLELLH